jgi:hypothetical protein
MQAKPMSPSRTVASVATVAAKTDVLSAWLAAPSPPLSVVEAEQLIGTAKPAEAVVPVEAEYATTSSPAVSAVSLTAARTCSTSPVAPMGGLA